MSEVKQLSGTEGVKKLAELIKGIHICMMTTAAADGSIDSRPMATQAAEFDGSVWFLSRHETGKVAEIESDAHVSLLYADTAHHKFVAAKGKATVGRDQGEDRRALESDVQGLVPGGQGRSGDRGDRGQGGGGAVLGGVFVVDCGGDQVPGSCGDGW